MESQYRAIARTAAVLITVAAIAIASIGVLSYGLQTKMPTQSSSTRSTQSVDTISSNSSCDQPAYLIRLASQVERTQSFAQASHGLSYVLAFGDNQTEAGVANGQPISSAETDLTFYSYGAVQTGGCPSSSGTGGVVGAVWVRVPIGSNGSYDFGSMDVYFTPGVLTNSTVLTTVVDNTTSLVGYCNSTQGAGLYVTVLSDAGQPVPGVQVSGTMVGETHGGTCDFSIGNFVTNSTGSVLITPSIGSYYALRMTYQGQSYTTRAAIEPMTSAYVTLEIPSGNVSVSEVLDGGCQTNAGGTTCPS